jgi:hypothetical protein
MFGDYLAVHKHLFSTNLSPCLATPTSWDKPALLRSREVRLFAFEGVICLRVSGRVRRPPLFNMLSGLAPRQGLISVLLSLKKRPAIRYAAGSDACRELAKDMGFAIQEEAELFDFRQAHDVPPLLLVRGGDVLQPRHRAKPH